MIGLVNKREQARSCACGTSRVQPARSWRAERAAEHAVVLRVDVASCSLRHVAADRQLLADLATMDTLGLHRVCGWPRHGRRLDVAAGWAS